MQTNEISILIVEDDPITAEDIKEILEMNNFKVLPVAHNYNQAIEIFNDSEPNLLLVDINLMSEKSGIDFVKTVRNEKPFITVIFLSANTDETHKTEAFNVNPSAFISKPFNQGNLILALELAIDKSIKKQQEKKDFILIKDLSKYFPLKFDEILFIKAEGSYSRVVSKSGEYVQTGLLRNFEEKLPEVFIRVHKSYLVNSDYVHLIRYNKLNIQDFEIPIGRSYRSNLQSM